MVKDSGMFYIDMEYCESTLEQLLDDHRTAGLLERVALSYPIMWDIAAGVAFIHEQCEIHRDLKPRNSIPHNAMLLIYVSSLFSEKYLLENRRLRTDFRRFI